MLPVLETPRLVLRPFGKEDAAAVFAIYSDEETNTFLPWFPAKTAEDAAALCARHAEESFSVPVYCKGVIRTRSKAETVRSYIVEPLPVPHGTRCGLRLV